MSGTRKDGGAAFPTEPNTQQGFFSHHGMSLRDWFAGQALAGMMANPSVFDGDDRGIKAAVGQCYMAADRMLAERERQP